MTPRYLSSDDRRWGLRLAFLALSLVAVPRTMDALYGSLNAEFLYGSFTDYAFCLLLTGAAFFAPGPFWLYADALAFAVPGAAWSALAAVYGRPPTGEEFYFLWETNLSEASEYAVFVLSRHPFALLPAVAAILLPWPFLRRMARVRAKARAALPRAEAALLCLLAAAVVYFSGAASIACRFYQTLFHYEVNQARAVRASESARGVFAESLAPSAAETFVVVIGESASRHHMSLYGYGRRTDPEMAKLAEKGTLIVLRDVAATSTATTWSLLRALSFMDKNTGLEAYRASVVDLFKSAGFKTWWLSNNAVMSRFDTLLRAVSENADVRFFTKPTHSDLVGMITGLSPSDAAPTYDEALMEPFRAALSDNAVKKIIFVHLRGSHVIYKHRYPPQHSVFSGDAGLGPRVLSLPLASSDLDTINEYDSSIAYTDRLLGEMVAELEASAGDSRTWLLYFSDHGEEVFDFRMFNGRAAALNADESVSRYMVDVPLLIWSPNPPRETPPPATLDGLIHTIVDLGGIRISE
ncbi:MAG: phosphoethanolamine transferase [Synergistaceae bacterium]|nr:phosphoethanolamine transferase [Synergistaceae bacterium]